MDIATDISERELKLKLRLAQIERQEQAQKNFLDFVKEVWPEFIAGRHHKIIAKKFEQIRDGTLKRLIINMPPRHTKSEFGSYLLPAWLMGQRPSLKIIQATHTAELAQRFGRKVRNLMDLAPYKGVFPDVELKADSKAAGRWDTNAGGEYFAAGVGGAMTGRGADLLIIDDPHSEQDAYSEVALENCWEWYLGGPRSRLQPGGAVVLIMTRWSTKDLTGRLLNAMGKDIKGDKWEVVEFPAIFDQGEPNERPLWPEYWKLEELQAVRASISVPKWQAMYQQNPTADEGAIIPREWWRVWEKDSVPPLEYIIQSYDTAFSKKETADYSAITTWGVFYPVEGEAAHIMLLDYKKGRWDFPELKRQAHEEYKYWQPDTVLIEAKATGTPLTQELRRTGIPVVNYTPSRGQDKISRVHSVSPLFEAGFVWRPDTTWADELVEEVAAFPLGEHDDAVDSMTQALMRFRSGNFIRIPTDYEEEDEDPVGSYADLYY
jgi:predicted phage terminase large subunit-like protein